MNNLYRFRESQYLADRLKIARLIKKSKFGSLLSFFVYFFSKRKVELLSELRYFAGPVTSAQPIAVENKFDITPENFWGQVKQLLLPSSIILDLGCGIRPISFLDCKLLICVEPFQPYISYLKRRYKASQIVIVREDAITFLKNQPESSIDTIVAIDVLEHLPKDDGHILLQQMIRVCRIQSLVVTPNGFMPQHVSEAENDEWGFRGNTKQSHLSGWTRPDFVDWTVLTSPKYQYDSDFESGSGALAAYFRKQTIFEDVRKVVVVGPEVLHDENIWRNYLKDFRDNHLNWISKEILFVFHIEFSQGSVSLFREDTITEEYNSAVATFQEDFSKLSNFRWLVPYKVVPSVGDLIAFYSPNEIELVYKNENKSHFQQLKNRFEKRAVVQVTEL